MSAQALKYKVDQLLSFMLANLFTWLQDLAPVRDRSDKLEGKILTRS